MTLLNTRVHSATTSRARCRRCRCRGQNACDPDIGPAALPAPQMPAAKTESAESNRDHLIRSACARYAKDRTLVEATASVYGVNVFLVWRPIPTYQIRPPIPPLRPCRSHHGHSCLSGFGYAVMAKNWPSAPSSIWCADSQAGVAEPLYVDPAHYSRAMYGRLAQCIALGLKD